MTELCELAAFYGSDKVATILHDYTPVYSRLLHGRSIRRVLEIGIGTPINMHHVPGYKSGASLRMWRDYFPDTEIWGVDNDPSAMIVEDRINCYECDQGNEAELRHLAYGIGKCDLIIDDGSHHLPHQVLTANTLIPLLLSPTGIYVIEDVIWRKELYSQLQFPVEVSIRNLKRTPDDCLFIIEGSKL